VTKENSLAWKNHFKSAMTNKAINTTNSWSFLQGYWGLLTCASMQPHKAPQQPYSSTLRTALKHFARCRTTLWKLSLFNFSQANTTICLENAK